MLFIGLFLGLIGGWYLRESQEHWCDKFYRDYKSWLEYGSFEVHPVWNGKGDVVGWGVSANPKMLEAMNKKMKDDLHPKLLEKGS